MLALSTLSSAFVPAPLAQQQHTAAHRTSQVVMETEADLKALAVKQNPALGYWNPTGLTEMEFYGSTKEQTIGFLRQAEIKHGRVAMAGFVGFCVQSNWAFPWAQSFDGTTFADIAAAGGPAAQWDALPTNAKLQIFMVIGFLEFWGENKYALEQSGMKHYMRGGKPGVYPSLKKGGIPHPVPFDLFDPFNLQGKMTPEQKELGLIKEINNGRLAMIGLMGCISASKGLIVPGLDAAGIAPYDGQVMGPFSAADAAQLPFVEDMLNNPLFDLW